VDSPFAGKLWLAPLTRGGHLPFRRLCVEFWAEITVGEMVVVRRLLQNKSSEFALLKSHPNEPLFGVQLADRHPDTLAEGARIAESRGARFIDINCGCPIDQITRKGLGASLLKKPGRLRRLIEATRKAVSVPVTVKLRTGWTEGKENISDVARVCEEAGAAAITLHARTRDQRYSKAADWDLIGRVAAERGIPVVGNGDILTYFEARDRMARANVSSVMVARGALIKPWLFREIREGRSLLLSAEERLGVLWRFVELLREHFGSDDRGRARILHFLPWHLGFFCRYRALPEAVFEARSREHPLIQTRLPDDEGRSPLDALLSDPRVEVHDAFAGELLAAASLGDTVGRALDLAGRLPAADTAAREEISLAEVAG
jgi:tRNA-dihydrouridine synthase 3